MVKGEPEFAITEEPRPMSGGAAGARAAAAGLIKRCAELSDSLKQTSRQEQRKRRRFYLSLLQVADAFDRILADTTMADLDEIALNRMRSVKATSAMLQEALTQEDIVEMEDLDGQPFDPACEEAVATEVRADCADRTVLAVKEKGYRWREQVLRPARVVVSKQS